MSTVSTTDEAVTRHSPSTVVGRAAVVGVLAGLAFGVIMQLVLGRMTAVGAMYTLGDPSLTIGWVAHVFHSALFGAFFGLLVDSDTFRAATTSVPHGIGLGAAYATGLWLVNVVFVWPLWLNSTTFGATIPLPNLAPMPLVGHLVWGVLLGVGTVAVLSR